MYTKILSAFITKHGEVAVVINKKALESLSRKYVEENKSVILDMLNNQLSERGYKSIKTIEKEDKIFLFLNKTTKQDLGHVESIIDSIHRKIITLTSGSTQHTVTIFKTKDELPVMNFVFYRVIGDLPPERKERYSVLNKLANFLHEKYDVIFAKLDLNHIGTVSAVAVDLPEEVPVTLEQETGEELNFKLTKIKNEIALERHKKVFIKQLVSRAIRKKLREKGYIMLNPVTAINPRPERDIGKITIYSGFSYDIFLFSERHLGIAIKPLNRIVTRVSLFDYLDRDNNIVLLRLPQLIGRTAYFEKFSRRGVIQHIYLSNSPEFERLRAQLQSNEETFESKDIPIAEISSRDEIIYKPISSIQIAFTTHDAKADKNLFEYFKSVQKLPGTILALAKKYISEISPVSFGDYTIHFSTEPMEVFLE